MKNKLMAFSRNTFASLSKRNFRLYFTGQAISLTGGWMQNVAQAWLILHLTHSGTALGIASALQSGPTLFLGPYAGVLGTRFAKRRILFVTQTFEGLLALALGVAIVTDTTQAWMVYLMAGLLGVVNAVDYPIRQSFVYDLTGPKEMVSAVGLTTMAGNMARVIGPAIAAVIIGSAGLAACFFVNAASFGVVLVCLAMMHASEFHRTSKEPTELGVSGAIRYAFQTPVVREAILMMAVIGMITFEFSVTLPMLVRFKFAANASGLAYLMSSMGVGAVLGGLLTAGRRGEGLGRLTTVALGFGVSTALVGFAPTIWVATGLMLFVGVFAARFVGLSGSIVQLRSEPTMRTRMVALWSTAFIGSSLVGAPIVGWIGETAGPQWAMGVALVGGVVAASIGLWGSRREQEAAVDALPAAQSAERQTG